MSQRTNLITISYHHDTDTSMYRIGEIDFGISGELDNYLEKYGRKGIDDILKIMSHLVWHIQQYGYPIIKRNENKNDYGEVCSAPTK